MNVRRARSRLSYVAALLAVALLTMAGVRSIVMQAAEIAPVAGVAMCSDMADMAGSMTGGEHTPGKARKVCDFCSAAAHAPICGTVPAIVAPLTVRYVAWRPHRGPGAREPPAVDAKARGPPAALLTA